jgi:hypothetical protein
MSETETTQTEEKFSIILEDEPTWIVSDRQRFMKPVTRQLDIISAKNLRDAWDKAREKWILIPEPKFQIVDIIPGELTEPLRPSEHPIQQPTPEQSEESERREAHDG